MREYTSSSMPWLTPGNTIPFLMMCLAQSGRRQSAVDDVPIAHLVSSCPLHWLHIPLTLVTEVERASVHQLTRIVSSP